MFPQKFSSSPLPPTDQVNMMYGGWIVSVVCVLSSLLPDVDGKCYRRSLARYYHLICGWPRRGS